MTSSSRILITGGAGFIGVNAACDFLSNGYAVTILDNMSRAGAEANARFIREFAAQRGGQLDIITADVRDAEAVRTAVAARPYDVLLHLAAQVAVTTSVRNPREDFDINALGTFNVLEAARLAETQPLVIYSSTNKVYGGMEEVPIIQRPGSGKYETAGRYDYEHLPEGIPETQNLDFHSPYGCSKGAADQYVRDYARIYGLKTAVVRQSCIYGPRQFGIEDQGWVAWFTIAAVFGRPFHIYGDGKQVRDVLHVRDLVRAYLRIAELKEQMTGEILNVGGGAANAMSLLGLIAMLEEKLGRKLSYDFQDWRPGDQPVYISDIARAKSVLGWAPQTSPVDGVHELLAWVQANEGLIREQLGALLG